MTFKRSEGVKFIIFEKFTNIKFKISNDFVNFNVDSQQWNSN